MSLITVLFILAVLMLLATGAYSLIVTRNLLRILISVEIMTKGVTLLIIGVGYLTGNIAEVSAYVITVIIIEVVLLAIATGIILGIYRKNESLDTRKINNLKG